MPTVRVTDATWERMKAYARPFEDKPEDIVKRALDAFDELSGRKSAKPEDIVKPALDALDEQSGPKMAKPVPVYSRKVDGRKLPQREFRVPLLKTLLELGGIEEVSRVRKVMAERMAPLLSDADYQPVSSGEERWWNAICWERADLVREGCLFATTSRVTPGRSEVEGRGDQQLPRPLLVKLDKPTCDFKKTLVEATGLLSIAPDATVVLNVGSDDEALIVDLGAATEQRVLSQNPNVNPAPPSVAQCKRGDAAFFAECRTHLQPEPNWASS